jgi:predicted transcriptional regulator
MTTETDSHELPADVSFPKTLRITVEDVDAMFDRARGDAAGDGVADEAVRSFASVADIRSLLTDRRLEVLRAIMDEPPESITVLAERLERNYADVHGDVQVLANHHIVYFETEGRSKRPVVPYERVHLDIELAGGSKRGTAPA